MNIHITTEEFNELMTKKIIGKFIIGSKLYGTDDENSDTDYLVIMYPFKNKRYSAFSNHHQCQYKDKDNNIDYNFVDIIDFIDNLVSGDSTVNYELLYSPEFQANTEIGWLSNYIEDFRTYNIIKSYCGLVERDIKHFNKRVGSDRVSGLCHIKRGFYFAQDVFYKKLCFDINKTTLKLLKFSTDTHQHIINNLQDIKEEIKEFRKDVLNKEYEAGKLPRYLDPKIQLEINHKLTVTSTATAHTNWLSDSLLLKIFNTNENTELKYD